MITDMVFPSHHIDVGADLALAQREAVKIELVLLPHLKDVEDLLESLESKGNIALASICLAVFCQEPDTLHIQKIRQGTANSFCASEKPNCLESLIVFVVAKLVLGCFCVNVSILKIKLPGSIHCLGGFLYVSAMLNDSCLGHGKINA